MADHRALREDADRSSHYYHCILYRIPQNVPVQEIAERIVPNSESRHVAQLQQLQCSIVPHQLHVFKEPLQHKFGFVTFLVNGPDTVTERDLIHTHAMAWIEQELSAQLLPAHCSVQVVQPAGTYSSYEHMRQLISLPLLDPNVCRDPKKLLAFLLSKQAESRTQSTHGALVASQFKGRELVWLKHQFTGDFPQVLISKHDLSDAACEDAELRSYLSKGLTPLFSVIT